MPGSFKYIPTHEVDARHRSARMATPHASREGAQRNVAVVLSLGTVRYITFHHYLLAIPPVPFKLGQEILSVYVQSLTMAKKVAKTGEEKATEAYYRHLNALAELLWSHVQPVKRFHRILKRLHLARNIFKGASEKEVQDITDFFLQCRMISSVRATEMTTDLLTPTSSMNLKSS